MSKHDKLHLTLSHQAIIEVIELLSDEAVLEIKDHLLKQALNSRFSTTMPEDFNEQCAEYLDSLAHKYFEEPDKSAYATRWKIKESIRKKLRKVADEAFCTATWEKIYKPTECQINEVLKDAVGKLKQHIDYRLELWEVNIEKYLEKKVNSTMVTYIDKAVEAKFELMKAQWEADLQGG